MRANFLCVYRPIQQLRIENETHSVAQKVKGTKIIASPKPKYFTQPLDLQARNAFFGYYVDGTCWDFMRRYYHPIDCPGYLSSAVQAVGLAYLWHQVYSDTALADARECYVLALKETNKALNSSTERMKDSTLIAILLLDLFERITDCQLQTKSSWMSHVNGALAIVKLRGLKHFNGPFAYRILQRMSSNFMLGYVASSLPVPCEIIAIRDYVGHHFQGQGAMRLFSDLTGQYANLRCHISQSSLTGDEKVEAIQALDKDLKIAVTKMPPVWQYITTIPNSISERIFGIHVDFYPQRNTCLAWNVLRVIRILLNEMLIEHNSSLLTGESFTALIRTSQENIQELTDEICASVPQYTDCYGAARARLPASHDPDPCSGRSDDVSQGTRRSHTPKHQADCYTLLFPLYVIGKVNVVFGVRAWAVKELRYIGSHFYIRNAEILAQVLEEGAQLRPWKVYAMLGGYAFTV